MNPLAVIIAAHGSRCEAASNARVTALADELVARGVCGEAHAAFHQGEPSFQSVLDRVSSRCVLVVPLMAATGWYSETVLPRELGSHPAAGERRMSLAAPIGAHRGMAGLVARRVNRLLQWFEWPQDGTSLALVGHGTPRHPRSRDTTEALAERLRRESLCAEVITAYLDDDPPVETILDRALRPCVVLEPFLINDGHHAAVDVPNRVGLGLSSDAAPPVMGEVGGRSVALDSAVGADPALIELVIDAVVDHARSVVPRVPV